MNQQDFLVELGTEELPPKYLKDLSNTFSQQIIDKFNKFQLSFESFQSFATPRRLALLVKGLDTAQCDQNLERKGPSIKIAFDADKKATKAAKNFAYSNGVTIDQLKTRETDQGSWLIYRTVQKGLPTIDLLPDIVSLSLSKLPIQKRMRWGTSKIKFIRPVRWLVMLMGNQVVDCKILNLQTSNQTRGHRFHANIQLTLSSPADYQKILKNDGKVIACFKDRRQIIHNQVVEVATNLDGKAVIDKNLLDEVTALNEWPVALAGRFDDDFLEIPTEILVTVMKKHQKYFHIISKEGNLAPYFITIANIQSLAPEHIISGNEQVIRSRFADAKFFFETDKKISLEARREQLKSIVFQMNLGSIFDKTNRIAKLAGFIALQESRQIQSTIRAGELCKSDLNSKIVQEYPELQGIMNQYYAINDGEEKEVCIALNEQYLPRFAGDILPSNFTGCAIAIADKIDTIVGIFGINQSPSGNKDPFALRRAALGTLRIIVEKKLDLDLCHLINQSIENYCNQGIELLVSAKFTETVLNFILERFCAWYQDDNIPVEIFWSVKALAISRPFDFDQRVRAVHGFNDLAKNDLLSVNKRISNILAKAENLIIPNAVNQALISETAERDLAAALVSCKKTVSSCLEHRQYIEALESFAQLKQFVDYFFEKVFIHTTDKQIRLNRYALLKQLHNLFLHIFDISFLQRS